MNASVPRTSLLLSAFLSACLAATFPSLSAAQVAGAAELGATLVALQQMRSQLDGVVNTVDTATANRIKQAEIAIDQTITKVKDAMDHGYGLVNNTRDQVMGNIATTMTQTHDLIQNSLGLAFDGVNNSLVNVSTILTGIPFINIPAYIYAVTPIRILPDHSDRQIQIHGFFPDAAPQHPVIVTIDNGSATGERVKADQFVNHTFAFDLPQSIQLTEGKFVTMSIDVPVKHLGGLYYSANTFKNRIYVERKAPFTFTVTVNVENPAIWATITASAPLVAHADSNLTTNNQTLTAASVFSSLINDNVTYDMSTATFVAFSPANPVGTVGSPCASGCSGSSGSWSWTANTVSIVLSAPNCPIHLVSPGFPQIPYQCAGGTHADFAGTPTFKVRQRNVTQLEIVSSSTSVPLGRKSVAPSTPLPSNWT